MAPDVKVRGLIFYVPEEDEEVLSNISFNFIISVIVKDLLLLPSVKVNVLAVKVMILPDALRDIVPPEPVEIDTVPPDAKVIAPVLDILLTVKPFTPFIVIVPDTVNVPVILVLSEILTGPSKEAAGNILFAP